MLKNPSFTTRDIYPLTDFLRNSKTHIRHLQETGQPEILTVNGKAVAVLQDPDTYDKLLARIERAELVASLREALAQVDEGKSISLEELEAELNDF
jgi:hypothetical protein